jgi:hypothetical protein
MKRLICLLLSVCVCVGPWQKSAAALQVDCASATGITRTAAWLCGNVVSTNGGTNTTYLRLYYGTSDGGSNAASWASTNGLISGVATGAVSTNITGLTASQLYYYRWYLSAGTNTAWAAASTSFWTLAGSPTGSPATATSWPVQADSNGVVVSPTNFAARNGLSTTNADAALSNALVQLYQAADIALSNAVLALYQAADSNLSNTVWNTFEKAALTNTLCFTDPQPQTNAQNMVWFYFARAGTLRAYRGLTEAGSVIADIALRHATNAARNYVTAGTGLVTTTVATNVNLSISVPAGYWVGTIATNITAATNWMPAIDYTQP